MKKIKLFLSFCLFMAATSMTAQDVPQAINFQAIARDANNEVLANTDIMIQLSILDGSADGPQVYREIRSLTTNAYGSFSFQIGRDPYMANGVFSEIDWADSHKFLKIDYDPTATLSFNLSLGTIEFVSVPYAFAAGSVTFIDATGANDGDVLTYNAETGHFEPHSLSVPDWALQPTKPTYDYSEIENTPDTDEFVSVPNMPTLAEILSTGNSAGGNNIGNLPSPTNNSDVINKAYIDSVMSVLNNALELVGVGTGVSVSGNNNGHDYVDLGLPSGTLWATCNIGAYTPEESGDLFACGETEPKEIFTQETYKYYENGYYTKYNCADSLLVLEDSDDAACINWGGGWRMPSYAEIKELIELCSIKRTNNGFILTGLNGNKIFLPCNYPQPVDCKRATLWSREKPNCDSENFRCIMLAFDNECGVNASPITVFRAWVSSNIRPVFTPQK